MVRAGVVVVVVEDFGSWVFRIFGEFSEFIGYSIWEVRYDILFDILKSPMKFEQALCKNS